MADTGHFIHAHLKRGVLEVWFGSMFSGKTTALISQIELARIAGLQSRVFVNALDENRYGAGTINSHSKLEAQATAVEDPAKLYRIASGDPSEVIIIDEGQFFPEELLESCLALVRDGKRVIVGGLNLDFRGLPFNTMALIMAAADVRHELTAICRSCKGVATRTQRTIDGKPALFNSPIILVGGTEGYEARCVACHEVPGIPELNGAMPEEAKTS